MFPEETDRAKNVPTKNNSCYALRQKLLVVAVVQQESALADHGVMTTEGNYWGMVLAGLLRIVKQAKTRDRQTQRLLAGITDLILGQSYSDWML